MKTKSKRAQTKPVHVRVEKHRKLKLTAARKDLSLEAMVDIVLELGMKGMRP